MKIINDGLPTMIYAYLSKDLYDHEGAKDTLTATTFLKPVQEVILTRRYWDKIEVPASERFWSLLGSGVHAVLETVEQEGAEQEERLYAEIEGQKISGKFDVIYGNTIHDYKVTSAFTILYGSKKQDWIDQLSIYRFLYFVNKDKLLANEGKIIAILRDWQQKLSEEHPEYPKTPILEVTLPLKSVTETRQWLTECVVAVRMASNLNDHELPHCTPKERWFNAKTKKNIKCERYCTARDFCHQRKESC